MLTAGLVGTSNALAQKPSYPAWFRQMPTSDSALWAVGYARGYRTLSAGMEAAKTDAYERLRRGRRMTIKGEKLYENAPGFQMSFEGARFTEMGRPDTLRSVTYVDSAKAAGMTVVLAAWTPGGAPPSLSSSFKGKTSFSKTPPSWVQAGPKMGAKRKRVLGRASQYYHRENSWTQAEKRGRHRLAFQAASKIERLQKNTNDWEHDVISIQTKVRLRHAQTVARWSGGNTCYVLVEGIVEETLIDTDK